MKPDQIVVGGRYRSQTCKIATVKAIEGECVLFRYTTHGEMQSTTMEKFVAWVKERVA